jgi:hypothetical protein
MYHKLQLLVYLLEYMKMHGPGNIKFKKKCANMFKILGTYICWKNIYKMQHLEGSGTPVLYIGRTVFKG